MRRIFDLVVILGIILGLWAGVFYFVGRSRLGPVVRAKTVVSAPLVWQDSTTATVLEDIGKTGKRYATVLVPARKHGCDRFKQWMGDNHVAHSSERAFLVAHRSPVGVEQAIYEEFSFGFVKCDILLVDSAAPEGGMKDPSHITHVDDSAGDGWALTFTSPAPLFEP